eukprot:10890254-Prorocentrum_lima.AAC.1
MRLRAERDSQAANAEEYRQWVELRCREAQGARARPRLVTSAQAIVPMSPAMRFNAGEPRDAM